MIVYGRNVIREAIRSQYPISQVRLTDSASKFLSELLKKASHAGVAIIPNKSNQLDAWAGTETHQGVAAEVADFNGVSLNEIINSQTQKSTVVILDQVQDPRNLGAIARTAFAAGAGGMVLPRRGSAPVSAVALKASAGAFFHIKVAYETNLTRAVDKLKNAGYWVYGADAKAGQDIYTIDFAPLVAMVFGGEGKGLRQLVKSKCDQLFRIPMQGQMESLNVSVAAGVALYEIMRKK